ncbi:MAG: CPBP family intramembrane metalloprotease [Planctomycetota bacterium]|nr:MAG: CPBP family intramembrane metalloprotease [Planctomycetota bacterium]REJ89956.1 MAG: CPBP family intramembrane metalloprotease [Planctomycetota bacterium]REK28188.1 MAG: CPBP family intramembrane metalloprotease [Planctomycetota bacterium]REK42446.1 MAG: CPBP family intramembrane metalloprotease [Planctomycetota bacterium]
MMSVLENTAPAALAAPSDYWQRSREPLASLLFILPLLLLYEGGILWLGPDAVRNGADVWMQQLLQLVGFGGYLMLPLVTVGILVAWHHTIRRPWRVPGSVLYGMTVESACLATVLVMIAHLHVRLLSITGYAPACDLQPSGAFRWFCASLVRFFGAGIYEELLFRLVLLSLVVSLVALLGATRQVQLAVGVLSTSLIFAAAHYVGPHGEPLETYTFVFRTVAGGFFAVLFVTRGFGIAAGTHALYDVFVGMPAS